MDFETEKTDFERYLEIFVYVDGIFLIDQEEEKRLSIKVTLSNIESIKDSTCEALRSFVEEKVKKYIVAKIKEKCINVVEVSRTHQIPVRNVLHCFFINNRYDNIEIIWSGSAIKEFSYVPVEHYLQYNDEPLYLKVNKIKFKKKF